MLKRQSVLRAVALPAAAALFTMGAVGPTYADGEGGGTGPAQARSHSSTSSGKSQGATPSRKTGHRPSHESGRTGNRGSNGGGHTPVTVCHLLGNGGYHLLTFDDNALKAHLGHGDLYPVPAEGCPTAVPSTDRAHDGRQTGGRWNGGGHTPVTVCHLLGNGGYHLLTFDDNALRAHLGHGDLYPVPESGCPAEQPGPTSVETTPLSGTEVAGFQKSVAARNLARALGGRPATVLGVETVRSAARPAGVLGNEASRAAARPAAVLGTQAAGSPAAGQAAAAGGILPQTGAAGPLGMALLAGLGLLGAGAAMVTRKRPANR